MDLRDPVINLVEQAKDVMERLHTVEAEGLTHTDLHILEVQIYLLDKAVKKVKALKERKVNQPPPPFPPLKPDQDKK
jgi:hypothetical protein